MSHHDHDDGLVHTHDWARDKPRPAAGGLIGLQIAAAMSVKQDAQHDDGLVHDHGWACGDRGRMRRAG